MKWTLIGVLMLFLGLASARGAETQEYDVRGGSGAAAYQGTVRVSSAGRSSKEMSFVNVVWSFGAYVIKGYGVVARDDKSTLTVSFVAPAGLGVGRYSLQSDGSMVGALVGEKGFFVQEVWTPANSK